MKLAILTVLVVCLTGCAAGPNVAEHVANAAGNVAGFWLGVWHGFISPLTFIVSLLADSVSMYEVHNNGGWYDLGFVLGAGILFGGGRAAT